MTKQILMIGCYDSSQISFITVSYSYIDFFLRLTQVPSIGERKFDDIDPEYGLHDITIKIEIRNNKQSFWYEIFPGIFTHKEFSKGYAVFNLINSAKNQRHFNFDGKIHYDCESMVKTEEFNDLCYVDIVMLDEFNLPFLDTSTACRVKNVHLPVDREFSNQLDYNYQDGETLWIRSDMNKDAKGGYNNDIVFRIQFQYTEDESICKTYVTDLQIEVKLSKINEYYHTSYK